MGVVDEKFECSRLAGNYDFVVFGNVMRIAKGCNGEERKDETQGEKGKYLCGVKGSECIFDTIWKRTR